MPRRDRHGGRDRLVERSLGFSISPQDGKGSPNSPNQDPSFKGHAGIDMEAGTQAGVVTYCYTETGTEAGAKAETDLLQERCP